MIEDLDIQNALRSYAAPVPDNGFTAEVLNRNATEKSLRLRVLAAAGTLGGGIALSQMPGLWRFLAEISLPSSSPLAFTILGVLGFVGWAALDRGWSDAV